VLVCAQQLLSQSSGFEALIATLNQHQTNPEVVKACFLLIEAAAYVVENNEPLRKLGVVSTSTTLTSC
jgi:hypothetical protein